MKPDISEFIPGSLEDRGKHIKVADRHHVTAKQKRQVQINCVTIMEILSLQHYTTYFCHQIYVTSYFQSLLYRIQDILIYSKKGFELCTL